MTNLKKPLVFALSLLPIAIAAGFFVSVYQLDILPEELIAEVVAQLGSSNLLIVISVVQTVGYALFCGFVGYILADTLGLWKPVQFKKKNVFVALGVSVIGGILLGLDYWTFGKWIEPVGASYTSGITASNVLASVLYGGIIEEVMLRLFFMSLIALVIWKVFYKKYDREHIPTSVFVAANIIAALAFAAGHLPATSMLFGELTPLILLRCFLLNGGAGLVFGWLYRKYGIVYAMIGHMMFHVVSKLIWILFI